MTFKTFFYFILLQSLLVGCGSSGGNSGTADQTPTAVVDLTAFKNVCYGKIAGSQITFNLTGTDQLGNNYTGTYQFLADGATTFENQNVYKARRVITIKDSASNVATSSSTFYYLISNDKEYKVIFDGSVLIPSSQSNLPTFPHVGDSGSGASYTYTDGTTSSSNWTITSEANSSSKYTLNSVQKNGSSIISSSVNAMYFDSAGTPTKLSMSSTSNGNTLNLSGSRTPVVNLSAFKNVLYGKVSGAQYSFTLNNADTADYNTYVYQEIADGKVTYDGKDVYKKRRIITVKNGSQTVDTKIFVVYFNVADDSYYKTITSTGEAIIPTSQAVIPTLPRIGDFGDIETLSFADGKKSSTVWLLEADASGTSKLKYTITYTLNGVVDSVNTITFYLDSSGLPTKLELGFTSNGTTSTLSGSVN